MEIVIEYVLIENYIINFFILKTCEVFIKEKASLKFLNCIFGALFALAYPLFNLSVLGSLLCKILVGAIMVCISFPFKTFKRFSYIYFAFVMMTFVFGGTTAFLTQLLGSTSVFVIVTICGIMFLTTNIFLRTYTKKKIIRNFKYCVRLFFNGNHIDETGYFDSGNILYDSISNKPIILITPSVFERVTGQNYYEFVLKNNDPSQVLKNCHYVAASTSMSQGKMLVFELDKLQIIAKDNEVKEYDGVFVGLSFADFNKSFDSDLLLHSSLI